MYTTNEQIARRVYRALKTPSDHNRRTDPILAFSFKGRDDYIIMRCNKQPEISIKGKNQTAGEVKFFAYSDFSDYDENNVLVELRDDINKIELYRRGAIVGRTFKSWKEFTKWLDTLDEATDAEEDRLDMGFDVRPYSRLGCQVRVGEVDLDQTVAERARDQRAGRAGAVDPAIAGLAGDRHAGQQEQRHDRREPDR